jgi:gliding motility-associated-like protein
MIKNNFLMHTSFRILMTTLGSIFCLTMASGQSLFQRLYAVGDSMTSGYFITEASSGNVIVSGTINRGNARYDGILWMLDPEGKPLWTLKVGRGTTDELRINDVLATPDGGCIFLGNYDQPNSNKYINSIVKLNSLGATEWVKKTAVPSYLEFRSILKITGGYLITGSNLSVGAPVIKVDESGNFVWGKTVNGYDYFGEGATEFPNGDILIPGGSARGAWIKVNSLGQVIAYYHYEDPTGLQSAFGYFSCCMPDGDSLIFIGGDYNARTLVAVKTDMLGNPGSIARISSNPNLNLLKVIRDADDNFLLSCYSGNNYNIVMIKISRDFDVLWAKSYGKKSGSEELVFDMTPAATGGYWFAGDHLKNDKYVMYLARTDDNGEIPGACCPRPLEVKRLPCYVKKVDLGYTTSVLPEIVDGTIIASYLTTKSAAYCEVLSEITLSDTTICPGSCVDIALGGAQSGSQYAWTFPSGIPDTSTAVNPGKVCYKGSGDYKILLAQDGCLIDSAALKVDNPDDPFPNAFTPNADGINETFKPLPLLTCPVDEYHFQVFNRWGAMVFDTTDPNAAWDGTVLGQPAPVDVYVYRVQYYMLDGDVRMLVMNAQKEVSLLR